MIQHNTDPSADDAPHIVERPDGFYWVAPDSGAQFGPFPTLAMAKADMESSHDSREALKEAEAELGISDWIDPDTGAPAEDGVPRLDE